MSFCTLGINSILVKELINHPEDEGTIIGTTLVLRALSSFLSAAMIIGLVIIIDSNKTTVIVVALCSIALLFNIFETINYWFHAKMNSKVIAISTFFAYIVTAAYKLFLVISNKSVIWFALATSVDYIFIALLLLFSYKFYKGKKFNFSLQYGKRLLKSSYHFIFPSIMVAIYGYSDKFMLKQIMSEAEVGYYSTAVAICSMWVFVLAAIIDSAVPLIMETRKSDIVLYEKRNKQLYAIVFYFSILVSIIISIGADLIVSILYGNEYMSTVSPLRIITWYTAFSYLGVARNAWVVCENKQKFLKYLYFIAAVTNVLLNFLFIPMWSSSGAALASLITQIITIIIIPFFIKEMRNNSIMMLQAITLKGLFQGKKIPAKPTKQSVMKQS